MAVLIGQGISGSSSSSGEGIIVSDTQPTTQKAGAVWFQLGAEIQNANGEMF